MSDQETILRTKKERTPAQLEHLKMAREKALQVRRANAELKKKEMEVDKAELDQKKKARVEAVETAYKQLKGGKSGEEVKGADADDEEEVEYIYEPKIKKKRKRVVVVQQSDSEEDEVEVVLPKSRQHSKREITSELPKVDSERQAMYNKMFGL